jgi:glucosyl-dolichyl phosphate glucuronosyltransferase
MHVSVIIATYNRARMLQDNLGALASQEVPASLTWEIVVVDNNSSDATAQVVAAFSKTTSIPVRYVFEPRQGLSAARNRGVQEARGTILAFSDDDVLPAPDWIAQVAAAMDRWSAQGVGGRILPRWETPPPRWLTENWRLMRRLSIMDFEGSRLLVLPLQKQPQVWGANMAFRRELFDRVGGFDPRRGMTGHRLFRGEESDLIDRALELGLKIAYDSALTVYHRIGSDRMQKTYFRRLTFDSAEGDARAAPLVEGLSFRGAPLSSYPRAFVEFWKWIVLRLLRRPGAFDQELRWLGSVGTLTGYWKARPGSS